MSFGTITSTANTANLYFNDQQSKLFTASTQATTGKRINTAADDPSGLAISTNLQTQAASFDAASQNVQNAQNAVNVADGALQTTSDSLQALNSIAVQASNDLLSPSDRANLQTVANQLVQQINTDAQNAGFNGTQLLTGSFAGPQPATPAGATVTSNASLSGGGNLVTSVSAAPNAQAGTINVAVVNGGSDVQATFTDSQTGKTTTVTSTATPGSSVTVNGTTVNLGNFTAGDNTATATVQVTGAQAATNNATLTVQSGAQEGATTGVNSPNGTTQGLLISNIDLSSSQAATNAQGQIDTAIQQLASARATLGAQTVSLGEQLDNNNNANVNLTASAANISDKPAAASAAELNLLRIQSQVSLFTLQNANNQFGYLNRFFNTGA